jgi:TPR repeat protein
MAQYNIGFLYHCGMGVQKNRNEAYKWYKKTVDNSNPGSSAQYKIGIYYLDEQNEGDENNKKIGSSNNVVEEICLTKQ